MVFASALKHRLFYSGSLILLDNYQIKRGLHGVRQTQLTLVRTAKSTTVAVIFVREEPASRAIFLWYKAAGACVAKTGDWTVFIRCRLIAKPTVTTRKENDQYNMPEI